MTLLSALPARFSVADFEARARARLAVSPHDLPESEGWSDYAVAGLHPGPVALAEATPAAVLVPIIARRDGATVLFTVRSARMKKHSGQIAFPGGKIDAVDADARAAALREAEEEVGLAGRHVTPLGFLGPYVTGTGFRITPLVALVDPAAAIAVNPDEVAEIFETPLAFLMDPANHALHTGEFQGATRSYFAMPHGDRYIWGATAGMLRMLWRRLYAEDHR
ncbi:MAG: CoA pyrophosphatase [Beijerinckiaceae bacterium]